MKSKQLTLLALLTTIGLILFVIEAQIPLPLPIPGVKLGLSNVVVLVALWTLGRKPALTVLTLRIVLGNFVVGNLAAMLYSLSGGLCCFLLMALLRPLFSDKQVFILSIFGAIAHNVGQLTAAILITQTIGLLVYAPVLLLSGIVTGFFTGQCAQAAIAHMRRLQIRPPQ